MKKVRSRWHVQDLDRASRVCVKEKKNKTNEWQLDWSSGGCIVASSTPLPSWYLWFARFESVAFHLSTHERGVGLLVDAHMLLVMTCPEPVSLRFNVFYLPQDVWAKPGCRLLQPESVCPAKTMAPETFHSFFSLLWRTLSLLCFERKAAWRGKTISLENNYVNLCLL